MAAILATVLLAIGLLVIAWAWIDGGRRPLRTIVDAVGPQQGLPGASEAPQ